MCYMPGIEAQLYKNLEGKTKSNDGVTYGRNHVMTDGPLRPVL